MQFCRHRAVIIIQKLYKWPSAKMSMAHPQHSHVEPSPYTFQTLATAPSHLILNRDFQRDAHLLVATAHRDRRIPGANTTPAITLHIYENNSPRTEEIAQTFRNNAAPRNLFFFREDWHAGEGYTRPEDRIPSGCYRDPTGADAEAAVRSVFPEASSERVRLMADELRRITLEQARIARSTRPDWIRFIRERSDLTDRLYGRCELPFTKALYVAQLHTGDVYVHDANAQTFLRLENARCEPNRRLDETFSGKIHRGAALY